MVRSNNQRIMAMACKQQTEQHGNGLIKQIHIASWHLYAQNRKQHGNSVLKQTEQHGNGVLKKIEHHGNGVLKRTEHHGNCLQSTTRSIIEMACDKNRAAWELSANGKHSIMAIVWKKQRQAYRQGAA